MKIEKVILLLLYLATSCNNDHLQKVLVNSDRPDIDKIFYKIVQSESQEKNRIAIVDRSINIEQQSTNKNESIIEPDPIYWTKEIFPQTNFINGDSILLYMKTNPEKYWKLRESTSSGWIEISTPKFSKDGKEVVVDVFFASQSHFAASNRYLLELNENEWVIKEKKRTSIN